MFPLVKCHNIDCMVWQYLGRESSEALTITTPCPCCGEVGTGDGHVWGK